MGQIQQTVKQRYHLIDVLRAIAIICMVIYHGAWDLEYLFGVDISWFGAQSGRIFQRLIRWSFILLSGFCLPMGRSAWKRGLLVYGCSWIITLVTWLFMKDGLILFGVLSLLGSAMLITAALDKLFQKWNPWLGLGLSVLLFLSTQYVELGTILFGLQLPQWLYANAFTAYLGFPPRTFCSSDYVALIPWLFAFWMGYFAYRIMEKHHWLSFLCAVRCAPLQWLGKHSLEIYMIHQPVVYAALYLVMKIL